MTAETSQYVRKREELTTYFDKTAAAAWSRLTSDAPVSRIRETVRAGRDSMRATLLGWLPDDLEGQRLLDAGCGTGALAIEAAERGAEVTAVDVSPTLVDLAAGRTPAQLAGQIHYRVGDMLDPALGDFDVVVAMDSMIHYAAEDIVSMLATLAARTTRTMAVTFAPRTPALAVMHAVGRLIPHNEHRAPAIQPVSEQRLRTLIDREAALDVMGGKWYRAHQCRLLQVAGYPAEPRMNEAAALRKAQWQRMFMRLMPLADAAGGALPMRRLLRLALFQVSVGMAMVLVTGTLNRVMIVELGVPAALVALMIALPLVAAPFRALIGHRSDRYRSYLGWRRVPFIWIGSLLQFGGLAIMPFALIILSGDTHGPILTGQLGAALAFALVGLGMHTTQTAGLALACDLATDQQRPHVVALLFVMLLAGMLVAALLFGALLENFSQIRLIQVIQGAAVATLVLNLVALWRQEPRRPNKTLPTTPRLAFRDAWRSLVASRGSRRILMAVALGTAGFAMQDILLEPYGAEVLGLAVGATTRLTALAAFGMLVAFGLASGWFARGIDAHRLAAYGALVGVFAFGQLAVVASIGSIALFQVAVLLVGFGSGLFAVGTLMAAMQLADAESSGLVLGAWGAAQATAAGLGMAAGGLLRDLVGTAAASGRLGDALNTTATGYGAVYLLEILCLFITLAIIGPLARHAAPPLAADTGLGLSEFPTGN